MSKNYVKVSLTVTIKEAIKSMHDNHQNCVLVVDDEDFLEGILTYGDIRRYQSRKSTDTLKSDSRSLDVCDDIYMHFYVHKSTNTLLLCHNMLHVISNQQFIFS